MKYKKPDAELVWKQFEDDLVSRLGLNLIDRIVYAHLLRHSRLEGKTQFRFSLRWLARSAHLSKGPVRRTVRRLIAKRALRLIERTRAGHTVEVRLPDEIPAALPGRIVDTGPARRARGASVSLEEIEFSQGKSRREAIHARECGLCFYCLSQLTTVVRCLDHVVPHVRGGSNSYRNLVSCCVECNTQKGETAADDFLRTLYRLRRITSPELEARLRALDALAADDLPPLSPCPPPSSATNENPDAPAKHRRCATL